jgi:hypothetical protein
MRSCYRMQSRQQPCLEVLVDGHNQIFACCSRLVRPLDRVGWRFQAHPALLRRPIILLISGFYMELARTKYESASAATFYVNRYSRLIAPYWIVMIISMAVALFQPANPYLPFLQNQGSGVGADRTKAPLPPKFFCCSPF